MPLLAAPLRPGQLIAIPTPASPAPRDRLELGRLELVKAGFRVRLGPLALEQARSGTRFAGDDAARAAELNEMFRDPEVRAIICARGGYGTMRLLDRLDYDALVREPKIIVGFSDITALLQAVWCRAGLVTFHGRMAAMDSPWNDYDRRLLFRALTIAEPLGTLPHPPGGPPLVTIVPGTATGRLVGGNLAMLAALSGTPFELDPAGCILLLEDVREPLYRIDRMLTTLRLAGKLERVGGVVFGETSGITDEEGCPRPGFVSLLQELLGPRGIPCYYGLAAGHGDYRATVPLGVVARMDAARCELTLLEPALAGRGG